MANRLGLEKAGEMKSLGAGYGFGGEFLMGISKKVKMGISLGTLNSRKQSETTLRLESIFKLNTALNLELSSFPLEWNAYYVLSLARDKNLYLVGGFDYCFAQLVYKMNMNETVLESSTLSQTEGKVKDSGAGFHGGIGFDWNILDHLGLFVEIRGTYLKLNDWAGEETYSDSERNREVRSGRLWYYESQEGNGGNRYSNLILSEKNPEGFFINSSRGFELNLSGFSFSLGLNIRIK